MYLSAGPDNPPFEPRPHPPSAACSSRPCVRTSSLYISTYTIYIYPEASTASRVSAASPAGPVSSSAVSASVRSRSPSADSHDSVATVLLRPPFRAASLTSLRVQSPHPETAAGKSQPPPASHSWWVHSDRVASTKARARRRTPRRAETYLLKRRHSIVDCSRLGYGQS